MVSAFIQAKDPFTLNRISDANSPKMRIIIMRIQAGDILNINGLGILEVEDVQVYNSMLSEYVQVFIMARYLV